MSVRKTVRTNAMLGIRLLGDLEVARDGAPVALPQSRKTRALLAYLVATERAHQRERLCEIFWDVPDDPRGALRWSLSKIRQILGPEAGALKADRNAVSIMPEGLTIDYASVRALARDDLAAADLDALESAAEAFRGPFLADLALPRCPDYEAWRTALADECAVLRVRLLRALVDRLADAPERALAHAHALQTLLPEDAALAAQAERLAEAARARAARPPAVAPAPAHDLPPAPEPRPEPEPEPRPDPPPPAVSPPPAVPGAGARAVATVLAAEIVSPVAAFDAIDPELVERELAPLRQAVRTAVERAGGAVVAEDVSELVAIFGAPQACEDHAVRACAAALAMHAAVQSLSQGAARLRAGLDTGEVVIRAGRPGGPPEALGAPVRVAKLLMRALRRGLPAASARVRDLVGPRMRLAPLGRAELPGLPRDEPAFALEGENRALSRWALRAEQGLSAFVGREVEVMILERAAARARAGAGRTIGVVGGPGLGKSRLTHEFLDRAAASGMATWESAAVEFEALTPYRVVKKLLVSWLGLDEGADPAAMAGAVRERLEALGADAGLVEPLLFLLDLPQAGSWSALEPYERAVRLRESVRALVALESRTRPLVLLVEDLHWIDRESEAVLAGLADAIFAQPVLLVLTYRPDYANAASPGAATQVALGALDPFETDALLEHLLGPDASLDPIKTLLRARTEGVPLFLEEMVAALAASGRIVGGPGRYRCTQPPEALTAPSTIRAAIAARIDRLDPEARGVLQLAAVIGREVPARLLERLAGATGAALPEAVARLRAGDFVYEQQAFPSVVYAFKHALIHEVAYSSLLVEARKALHACVLNAMEAEPSRRDDEIEARAEHALRAEAWEAASRLCVEAADRAVDRSAYAAAVRFLDGAALALDALPRTPERLALAVDVRARMRPAYEGAGAYEAVFARLDEARGLAAALGDVERELRVMLHQSFLASTHDRVDEAIRHADALEDLARRHDQPRYVAEAALAAAQALALRAEVREIVHRLEPHRDAYGGPWRLDRFGMFGTRAVFFFGHLSLAYAFLGRFPEARAASDEARRAAEESRRPVDRYAALFYGCHARLLAGPDPALVAELESVADECRRRVPSPFYPALLARLAQAQMAAGRLAAAAGTLEALAEAAGRFGTGQFGLQGEAIGAALAGLRGAPDAAARLRAALEAVRAGQDPWMEALVLRAVARLGGPGALAAAREALALSERKGLVVEAAHSHVLIARLARADDPAAADASEAAAARLFAETGLDRNAFYGS
ncbi:AAA family ATPase [Salinarimonas sp.]|uniref:AAA family ATPase n=1 Tax=Salinarimonas sp. TaxID=2766526 RepID=UPI0032D8D30C